jgi:hypothetical protein
MPSSYALHLDAKGSVLGVKQFDHSYQAGDWLRSLSPEPGDRVEFKALGGRDDVAKDEPAPPAFLSPPAFIAPGDDQPL